MVATHKETRVFRLSSSARTQNKWIKALFSSLPGIALWWLVLGYFLDGLTWSAPVLIGALAGGSLVAGALSAGWFRRFDAKKFVRPLTAAQRPGTLLLAAVLFAALWGLSASLPKLTFPATHTLVICAPQEGYLRAENPFVIHSVRREDGLILSLLTMKQDGPWNSTGTGLLALTGGACVSHEEFFRGAVTVQLRQGPGVGEALIEWDGRAHVVDLSSAEEGIRSIEFSGDHPPSATLLRQTVAGLMRGALALSLVAGALGLALAFKGGHWGTGALKGDNVWLALGLLALMALLASANLGRSTALVSDDFCYSGSAVRSGWWDGTWFFYTNANGRLLGNSLGVLSGSLSPYSPLPFAVLLVLVLLIAGLAPLISGLLHWLTGRSMAALAWVLSGTVVLVTLLNTPTIYQSLFWRSGRQPLLFPLMLLPPLLALLLDSSQPRPRVPARWRWLGLLLIPLFAAAFHEVYAAAQVAMLLAGILVVVMYSRRSDQSMSGLRRHLLAAFLGALAGLLVHLLSPGTAERSSVLGSTFDLPRILYGALYDSNIFLFAGNLNILTIGLFALGAVLAVRASKPGQFDGEQIAAAWLGLPIVLWAGVVAAFAVGHYGISETMPERTQVIPTFIAILGALIWGMLSGAEFLRRGQSIHKKWLQRVQILAVGVFGIAFVFHAYTMTSQQQTFDHYRRAVNVMMNTIEEARLSGAGHVVVSALPENPFGVTNPEAGGRNFVNRCVDQLFGIEVGFD